MRVTVKRPSGILGGAGGWEVWLIAEYEYARRRYARSKLLNFVSIIMAVVVGALALVYGVLRYFDWQWLDEHFGAGGSTRWTQDVIANYLTTSILLVVVGGLGIATFALGFLKVRKALDDDNQDAIKRWTFLTGLLAVLPGLAVGGLLELFIWRAHASERFTIFGLLGKAPEPPREAPSAMAVAAAQSEEDEARRKDEYMALFDDQKPAAAPPSGGAPGAGYAADSGSGYGQQQAVAPPMEGSGQLPAGAVAPAAGEAAPTAAAGPAAAAATAEAPSTQMHDQPSGAPICTCGRPMEWIADYSRYYCYSDDRYDGES
jgi:hypothetical protein